MFGILCGMYLVMLWCCFIFTGTGFTSSNTASSTGGFNSSQQVTCSPPINNNLTHLSMKINLKENNVLISHRYQNNRVFFSKKEVRKDYKSWQIYLVSERQAFTYYLP